MHTGPFYMMSSCCNVAAVTTDWYPEYVPDYFQRLINFYPDHNLPIFQISRKYTHNIWCYSANKYTNMAQNITPTNVSTSTKLKHNAAQHTDSTRLLQPSVWKTVTMLHKT